MTGTRFPPRSRPARRRAPLLCAALLAGAGCAGAASPLALSCLGCHQPRVDAATMPALNHLTAGGIAAALRTARDHPATGSIMARFAATLSDADIEALAHELGRAD